MRITRETLLKIAQETVTQRVRLDRGIVSAYATGSLLLADPLLGGTTDIDLFIVHDTDPFQTREIIRLSPDVHLDIAHHNQAIYRQPRHLRLDPWLGNSLYDNPLLLHDTQHWFEFTQASVRSQFWLPENVIGRVRPLAENARQKWINLSTEVNQGKNDQINTYLETIEMAANAIACLTGSPLAERRFLNQFSERAAALQRPALTAALVDLLGAPRTAVETLRGWLPDWEAGFREGGAQPMAPSALSATRLPYYLHGIEAVLESDTPLFALWPLLSTWNRAMLTLPAESANQAAWVAVCEALGLGAGQTEQRLSALDHFLDQVEECLDVWATANGA